SLVASLVQSKNPVAVRAMFSYTLDPFTLIEPVAKFKTSLEVQSLKTSATGSLSGSHTQVTHVKVDLVADHGKSWLRINAGSAWSLIHEFVDMEDDDDSDVEDETPEGICSADGHQHRQPAHVSKDTHSDMVLLVRSLVLAADQNPVHYFHRPQVTIHFAGIQEGENPQLEQMIFKAVNIGRYASSVANGSGTYHDFPVECVFGPMEAPSDLEGFAASSPSMDPAFDPFPVPLVVDDMNYFTPTLNLDITTLMSLCSILCHTMRPDPSHFNSPPLVLQAQQEHEAPVLPLLAKIFQGRERLVMSRTAVKRFKSILSSIGGPEEQWRGSVMIHDPLERVIEPREEAAIRERWVHGSEWARDYGVFTDGPPRIEVIEDVDTRPDTDKECNQDEEISEDIKRREQNELHKRIFMTGHNKRLTTLTANMVGYRTVIRMGLVPSSISIWFHAPRSLAEAKIQR
ncbi:hypothetical protein BGZ94_010013, partial [Podila epigama]